MPRRSLLIKLGLFFGCWSLLGLVSASQMFLSDFSTGRPINWRMVFTTQVPSWYLWGLLAPLILRAGRRFRIERGSWLPGLGVHLLLSATAALGHIACLSLLVRLATPAGRSFSFPETYLSFFGGWFHFEVLTYWAILSAGYAFEYYRKYREREVRAAQLETQLAQAQLETLKTQLHPHFLFNTLNAAAALVHTDEGDAAVTMLARLSDLLRQTLDHDGRQEVTLQQELDFLERYLDIQRMRFPDRLAVRLEIEPEARAAQVPNLILQPLVENAIRHGIAPRESAGVVEISARREGDALMIEVADDGLGLPTGWREGDCQGIGLANTRARLEGLYGTRQRFSVRDARGGGVFVGLTIPWRVCPAEANGDGNTVP
jgi:two-component sensor histidine kinase